MVLCVSERKAGNYIKSFITQSPLVIAAHFLMLPGFSTLALGILAENSQ